MEFISSRLDLTVCSSSSKKTRRRFFFVHRPSVIRFEKKESEFEKISFFTCLFLPNWIFVSHFWHYFVRENLETPSCYLELWRKKKKTPINKFTWYQSSTESIQKTESVESWLIWYSNCYFISCLGFSFVSISATNNRSMHWREVI